MDFTLEKWNNSFLESFISACSDPHLADHMCETLPYPMDTAFAAEYIRERMFNNEERQLCRAVIINDQRVGGSDVVFGSGVFQKNAELSLWIAKDFRGQGLGSRVISEMCRLCFDCCDIIRIEARPYSGHFEARAALEKAGFLHEGTMHKAIFNNNKIYDYDIYALIKE